MKLDINCYPCMLNMVIKIANLSGMNNHQSEKFMKETISLLNSLDTENRHVPPHYAATLNQKAAEIIGINYDQFDPYKKLKDKSNKEVMELETHMLEMIKSSTDKISMALKLSAMGNIIDFGAINHSSINIKKEILNSNNLSFNVYDIDSFLDHLNKGRQLLYIGDNSGEIVTDKIMISTLKKIYPKLNITFAARERAILNDITLADCYKTGIDQVCNVISSGSMHPGTILEETSEEFKHLFNCADIIISKGQGNYETLSETHKNNLFFIFRVKCEQVAYYTHSRIDSLILMQNKKEK